MLEKKPVVKGRDWNWLAESLSLGLFSKMGIKHKTLKKKAKESRDEWNRNEKNSLPVRKNCKEIVFIKFFFTFSFTDFKPFYFFCLSFCLSLYSR